ncbi:MAG: DUF4097 family beta strand repeat-containing protein [Oscillospiraceae bacterium]|nr:DUF4097 family beta strand repeat-containing protein [Oscillospiraceae bacterium]
MKRKTASFFIFFTVMIFLAACGGVSANAEPEMTASEDITQLTKAAQDDNEQKNPEQEFDNIEIELTSGTIKIYFGDVFSLTYDGGKVAEYSVTDSTLYVSLQSVDELILTLPSGYAFDTVTVSVVHGHFYADESLSAKELNFYIDEGEATLEGISVSENCTVNAKRGSVLLSGALAGTVDAQCNEGHIQIQADGQQTDFNYNLQLSDASVQIEGENYHGTLQNTIDNGAENAMNLACAKGEVSVEFEH